MLPHETLVAFGHTTADLPADPSVLLDDDQYMILVRFVGFAQSGHLSFFRQLQSEARRVILEPFDAELDN